MGRDTWRYAQHEREREAKRRMNPIWRGVGCVLLVALAVAGFLGAGWFLRENAARNLVYLPPELTRVPYLTFLPDGILLMSHRMQLTYSSGVQLSGTWSFPHDFGNSSNSYRGVQATISNKNNSNAAVSTMPCS